MWITAALITTCSYYFAVILFREFYDFAVADIAAVYCQTDQGALPVPALLPGGSRIDMQKTEFFVVDDL